MTSRSESAIVEYVQRARLTRDETAAALIQATEYLGRAAAGGSSMSIRSAISGYEAAYARAEQARLSWEDARMLAVMAGVEV